MTSEDTKIAPSANSRLHYRPDRESKNCEREQGRYRPPPGKVSKRWGKERHRRQPDVALASRPGEPPDRVSSSGRPAHSAFPTCSSIRRTRPTIVCRSAVSAAPCARCARSPASSLEAPHGSGPLLDRIGIHEQAVRLVHKNLGDRGKVRRDDAPARGQVLEHLESASSTPPCPHSRREASRPACMA